MLNTISDMMTRPVYRQSFLVQNRKSLVPISVEDVAVIMHNSLNYVLSMDGTNHILNTSTLDELEEALVPSKFFRANGPNNIQYNAIQSRKPPDNANLTVYIKAELKMEFKSAATRHPCLKKWLYC